MLGFVLLLAYVHVPPDLALSRSLRGCLVGEADGDEAMSYPSGHQLLLCKLLLLPQKENEEGCALVPFVSEEWIAEIATDCWRTACHRTVWQKLKEMWRL